MFKNKKPKKEPTKEAPKEPVKEPRESTREKKIKTLPEKIGQQVTQDDLLDAFEATGLFGD